MVNRLLDKIKKRLRKSVVFLSKNPRIGAGNNPMVGMTVACAVAVQEALNK